MNVAIVGSRSITDMEFLRQTMESEDVPTPTMIVSGGALGVDSLAQSYAKEHGLPIKIHYPNWNEHGKAAGFKRNVSIVEDSDFVLVLWDGDSSGALHDVHLSVMKRKMCKVAPYGVPKKIVSEDIYGFQKELRWLSNMWPCPITFKGMTFPSSENVYQAAKFSRDLDVVRKFLKLTPMDSKTCVKQFQTLYPEAIDTNFHQRKIDVMEMAVRAKFKQNDYLATKLILTGDVYIEETNNWGDRYWGVVEGEGENHLGKILMKIRSEIQ